MLAISIKMEPVIETAQIGPPSIVDIMSIFNGDLLEIAKHDHSGGHEGYIVFVEHDIALSDGHEFILVEDFEWNAWFLFFFVLHFLII